MLNVVSRIDNTCQPYLYRGEDCMKQFVEKLTEIKKDIFEKMNMIKPMDDLTNEQKLEFRLASNCSICGKKFEPDDEKVREQTIYFPSQLAWPYFQIAFGSFVSFASG